MGEGFWNFKLRVTLQLMKESFSLGAFGLFIVITVVTNYFYPKFGGNLSLIACCSLLGFFARLVKKETNLTFWDMVKPVSELSVAKAHALAIMLIYWLGISSLSTVLLAYPLSCRYAKNARYVYPRV